MRSTRNKNEAQEVIDGLKSSEFVTIGNALRKAAQIDRGLSHIVKTVHERYVQGWSDLKSSDIGFFELDGVIQNLLALKASPEFWDQRLDEATQVSREPRVLPPDDSEGYTLRNFELLSVADRSRILTIDQQQKFMAALIPFRDTSERVNDLIANSLEAPQNPQDGLNYRLRELVKLLD